MGCLFSTIENLLSRRNSTEDSYDEEEQRGLPDRDKDHQLGALTMSRNGEKVWHSEMLSLVKEQIHTEVGTWKSQLDTAREDISMVNDKLSAVVDRIEATVELLGASERRLEDRLDHAEQRSNDAEQRLCSDAILHDQSVRQISDTLSALTKQMISMNVSMETLFARVDTLSDSETPMNAERLHGHSPDVRENESLTNTLSVSPSIETRCASGSDLDSGDDASSSQDPFSSHTSDTEYMDGWEQISVG